MRKIVLLLLFFQLAVAAEWIGLGSFSLHSDYLYRGESPSRHQPAVAPELTFLHTEKPLLLDFWFLSSIGKNPYAQFDMMLSADIFQKGNNLFSLTAIGRVADIYMNADYALELQAAFSQSTFIPLMAEFSYEFLDRRSFLQLQSAYDFDFKLPWTLGLLGGAYLFEKDCALAGLSLSTYLQLGKLSVEPYSVLQLRIPQNGKRSLAGSISLTMGYEF